MKKILYLFFVLMFGFALAQGEIEQIQPQGTMPTDEEIMETIKKYIPDPNQQEHLFKETKKSLQELYSNQNVENNAPEKQKRRKR